MHWTNMEEEEMRDWHTQLGKQLDLHSRESYLSSRVRRLICELGIVDEVAVIDDKFREDSQAIFLDNFTLDLESIGKSLPDINEGKCRSEEWYSDATSCLSQILKKVTDRMKILIEEDICLLLENLSWTKHTEVFKKCLYLLKTSDNPTDTLLALLLITSVAERALGNVYLLKSKPVPFLLKDLLASFELQQIFGNHTLHILQVLIGPPISLNLRNVAWHGFLAPQELSKNCCYFLIAVLASLHQKLIYQDIIPSCIPERPIIDLTEYGSLGKYFPEMDNSRIQSLKNIIFSSCFVPSLFVDTWIRGIDYLISKRFSDYAVLMLPQLEHSLRRIFALVNKCPEKIMTAESSVFYVTFDEIISENLPSGERNKVKDVIGIKNMEILFDLLSHLEGPRLRDHISHGEANLVNFPEELTQNLLLVVTSLCIMFLRNLDLLQDPFIKEINELVQNYIPKYSPINILMKKVKELVDDMNVWKDSPVLQKPNNISVEGLSLQGLEIRSTTLGNLEWSCEDKYLTITELMWYHLTDSKFLDKLQINNLISPQGDLGAIKDVIETLRPAVLYPLKEEIEVIGHLRQIVDNSLNSSRQIQDCLKLKFQQFCNRDLRSRQRNTYWRMLNTLPSLSCGLRLIIIFVFGLMLQICFKQNKFLGYSRLIRHVTQYVENMKVMTQANKNRWEESGKLTVDFAEKMHQHWPVNRINELNKNM